MKKSANKESSRAATKDATLARMLKRIRQGRDVRKIKVRHVKAAVRQDTYLNLLKLEVAIDRLAGELGES
ncbi:MAG TPA: hypothetical protein VIM11_21375 [Tepidisphaeraceae bacterium]|jgi:hypothetical protein